MRMTPGLLIVGGLLLFWAAVFVAVFLPSQTMNDQPSDIWRPWTEEEAAGHKLYVSNGCSYCHSMFIRNNDWGLGADRLARNGD